MTGPGTIQADRPFTSGPNSGSRDANRLKDLTGQVVGSVFFGTMLRAMRNSTFQGKYGHGGRGEEIFSAQLHEIYSDLMGRKINGGLRESLYRQLEAQQQRIDRAKLTAARPEPTEGMETI